MDGVQKYSKHSKHGGSGVSISLIFRQLSPFDGNLEEADNINMQVHLPWDALSSVESLWKPSPNIESDIPMKTVWFTRMHFNYSGRHPCGRQAISSKRNIIRSVLVTSPLNEVAPNAAIIMFHAPDGYARLAALGKTKRKQIAFRVYCKTFFFAGLPPNYYLFCGMYLIATSYRKHNKQYFKFQRMNELDMPHL